MLEANEQYACDRAFEGRDGRHSLRNAAIHVDVWCAVVFLQLYIAVRGLLGDRGGPLFRMRVLCRHPASLEGWGMRKRRVMGTNSVEVVEELAMLSSCMKPPPSQRKFAERQEVHLQPSVEMCNDTRDRSKPLKGSSNAEDRGDDGL